MSILAVDIHSKVVSFAVFGQSGRILDKQQFCIKGLSGSDVSCSIRKKIDSKIAELKHLPQCVKSIGFSIPGIYFSRTGQVWAPSIPGWELYALKKDFAYLLVDEKINPKFASNRTCYILGEKWKGAAKNTRNAVYLSISNGVNAGVMVDGRIIHGTNDIAGAAGWVTLSRNHRKEYKEIGYMAHHASAVGLKKKTLELLQTTSGYSGTLRQVSEVDFDLDLLFEAYKKNDPVAKKVLNRAVDDWGLVSATLINLLNPEVMIFGGTVFGPATFLIDRIKKRASKWTHTFSMQYVEFVPSHLGPEAGLYGAGLLARKKNI